ncbi:MAG TPA: hypothetical protein PK990_00710 [Salinivirgaceae bacterium]|nr:hypothetical protein [Salinivirgaceae bacterium]
MTKFIHKRHLKQNNFIVPEGYFDQFERELYQKLGIDPPRNTESKPPKKLILNVYNVASIAAIFVIGMILSWYLISEFKRQSTELKMQNAELYFNKFELETIYTEQLGETTDGNFFNLIENEIDERILISALTEK